MWHLAAGLRRDGAVGSRGDVRDRSRNEGLQSRLGRSLRSRRMRSATPTPDPAPTRKGSAPIKEDRSRVGPCLAPRLPRQFNEQVGNRSPMLSVLALITLTCAILAGCTGASLSSTNGAATPAPSQSPGQRGAPCRASRDRWQPAGPYLRRGGIPRIPRPHAARSRAGRPGHRTAIHRGRQDGCHGDPGPIWIRTLRAQWQVLQDGASGDDGLYGHRDDRPTGPRPRGDRQSGGPESRSRRSDLHFLPFLPPRPRLLRPGIRLHSSPNPRLRAPRCDDRQPVPCPPRHPVAVRGPCTQ